MRHAIYRSHVIRNFFPTTRHSINCANPKIIKKVLRIFPFHSFSLIFSLPIFQQNIEVVWYFYMPKISFLFRFRISATIFILIILKYEVRLFAQKFASTGFGLV